MEKLESAKFMIHPAYQNLKQCLQSILMELGIPKIRLILMYRYKYQDINDSVVIHCNFVSCAKSKAIIYGEYSEHYIMHSIDHKV